MTDSSTQRALPALGPKSGRSNRGKGNPRPDRNHPLMPRVEAKTERDTSTGCWLWVGRTDKYGYGHISYQGMPWLVHRATYTELRGPIPDGLTIDHRCRRRNCVNPAHMEIVTQAENLRRGDSFVGINARKTHCSHGHEFTATTTAWFPDKTCTSGWTRLCAICHPDKARRSGVGLTHPEDRQIALETA